MFFDITRVLKGWFNSSVFFNIQHVVHLQSSISNINYSSKSAVSWWRQHPACLTTWESNRERTELLLYSDKLRYVQLKYFSVTSFLSPRSVPPRSNKNSLCFIIQLVFIFNQKIISITEGRWRWLKIQNQLIYFCNKFTEVLELGVQRLQFIIYFAVFWF